MAQVADAIEKYFIQNARELLATFSQLNFLVLAMNRPFCEAHFSNFLTLVPDYLNFGLFETNGLRFCSAKPIKVPAGLGGPFAFSTWHADKALFGCILRLLAV